MREVRRLFFGVSTPYLTSSSPLGKASCRKGDDGKGKKRRGGRGGGGGGRVDDETKKQESRSQRRRATNTTASLTNFPGKLGVGGEQQQHQVTSISGVPPRIPLVCSFLSQSNFTPGKVHGRTRTDEKATLETNGGADNQPWGALLALPSPNLKRHAWKPPKFVPEGDAHPFICPRRAVSKVFPP